MRLDFLPADHPCVARQGRPSGRARERKRVGGRAGQGASYNGEGRFLSLTPVWGKKIQNTRDNTLNRFIIQFNRDGFLAVIY